ncbi:abscisic acid 8'-hydroxylase 4-like [Lolium rigidum]|uniref:abscisic acid 8'-hydroxylase 4-like n=1 Tax=Lolium rigidum TaxID=89674 RepID=UPI001F5C524E|nr:abscisic acid 8'-hydroxylase 4-like [Lolium rigidum]
MTTMESEWRLAAHIFLLSAAIGGITYLLHRALRSFHLRQENRSPPPGGIGSWCRGFVGAETLSFLADNSSGRGFYHFVHTRALRYGACFRTSLFGRTHVFLLSAKARAAAACLLAADPPHFAKRYVRTVADLLGEHSLLCTSHDTHRRMRRAVAGLFASASTAAFAETFDRLTTDQLLATHFQDRVVVLDVALDVTFRAICEMLIGPQDDSQKLERLQSDVMDVTQAMLAVPLRLPGTRFYKGLQARKRIMDVLRQEISMRRQSSLKLDRRDDFLQTLLLKSHTDAPEEALTDEQILDNILTLIIAGQVTTATAITWMIKYLGDNTDLQEKLRSVQLDLASKHHGSPLSLQHLNTMDYAYKTVKESLRMATIVSWFPRVALKDCQVAGFHIKKDWIVNVDARSIHYDPTIYHNPTMFDPSRFNDDMKPYSFLVFGAGGRTCLGMNLAKIMMLIFLHRLVTNFRWEMADHDTSLERWAMFPRLKNGCPICLTPIHKKMY